MHAYTTAPSHTHLCPRLLLPYHHWFINLLTVLLFQHFFQTQCLVFYSTYQRATSLFMSVSLAAALFSLYLAFIENSCVWINVVNIKPNLCLYNKFYSNSNRFISYNQPFWKNGQILKKIPNQNVFKTFLATLIFRWFKFALKPPYSIACSKLWLAIWDTSFWAFWIRFGHKGPWDIS